MKIALASPRVAATVDEGLARVEAAVGEAAASGAAIVCFPEAYLPGLRGLDFEVPAFTATDQDRVLGAVGEAARRSGIAVVIGMERLVPEGRQIAAAVFGADGARQGWQTKNQLDPSEEAHYLPGDTRRIFQVNGVRFGVAICHEGFRYPETVRWAAARGAQLVFHPHCTGSDRAGPRLTRWGDPDAPYYEKAMMCRALENGIFFASVNYGFLFPESATSIIAPGGECLAHLPYGEAGLLVREIETGAATGLLATRFAPERYREEPGLPADGDR